MLDDELNVLPISRGKDISVIGDSELKHGKQQKAAKEMKALKESLADTKVVGELVALAKTLDQVRAFYRQH